MKQKCAQRRKSKILLKVGKKLYRNKENELSAAYCTIYVEPKYVNNFFFYIIKSIGEKKLDLVISSVTILCNNFIYYELTINI